MELRYTGGSSSLRPRTGFCGSDRWIIQDLTSCYLELVRPRLVATDPKSVAETITNL
jgi:hypothetical protein